MASLERNPQSGRYHVRYRFAGRSFKRSLKTSDTKAASAAIARLEETMSLVQRAWGQIIRPMLNPRDLWWLQAAASREFRPFKLPPNSTQAEYSLSVVAAYPTS